MALPTGRITNIVPDEISLVDAAANRRRFVLFKSTEGGPEMDPKIENVIKALGVTDEAEKVILQKALTPILDTVGQDEAHLAQVAESILTKGKTEKTYEDKEEEEDEDKMKMKKSLDDLDAKIARLEKQASSSETAVAQAASEMLEIVKALRTETVETQERNAVLAKSLNTEIEIRKAAEYKRQAEGLVGLPVETTQLAKALRAVDDNMPAEDRAVVRDALTKASKIVSESSLLSPIGSARGSAGPTQEVLTKANEIQKLNAGMTLAAAIEKAMEGDIDLSRRYLNEHGSRA